MRKFRYTILLALAIACFVANSAIAGKVQVFMPKHEDLSPMALRNKAMAEGFASAVLEEANVMLPAPLKELRAEAFKEYMQKHAKPYIQGYKILSVQDIEEGIILDLEVKVNRRSLRTGLKGMGLFVTSVEPLSASVIWPEDWSETWGEEAMSKLHSLMILTGIQNTPEAYPAFKLEAGPENSFKGRLETDNQEWLSVNKDLAEVWFGLWKRYFSQEQAEQIRAGVRKLTISGWFSPDGVLEFDRVLQSWESAVQEVKLVELDMQPTGVGGAWEMRLISGERLDMLLRSYLPQRGLTYQLAEDAEE
ncbi:hypothetical protein [Pseudodesulfovibrio sp. zrk46]|uniref:hypothetical protein n=1 Tax=Pseudodesulfovibrio sp. zrk46 TaxID=2725288 RepID=UPI0014498987|nr:hypothetical protein [Pseudodesulfovibrio sp. zrk46]QJB57856.1 hypothetical protein HFN16_16255 [Pseudodesulfovibrio sp. zrk46]